MLRTSPGDRERLACLIDNTFFAHYDGGRAKPACTGRITRSKF